MSAEAVPFDSPDRGPRPCPICGKPSVEAVAPFCSKRCADIDLHKWLKGVYAVPDDEPGQPDPVPDEDG
jgi:endogenous inhibitor of DNA gyrase (YacG/DUF329 family)